MHHTRLEASVSSLELSRIWVLRLVLDDEAMWERGVGEW